MNPHPNSLSALQIILPARLNQEETARYLGFAVHDIPTITAAGLLKPLGRPTQNSVKYFATVELERLRADSKWLSKATEAAQARWRCRRHSPSSRPLQGRRLTMGRRNDEPGELLAEEEFTKANP